MKIFTKYLFFIVILLAGCKSTQKIQNHELITMDCDDFYSSKQIIFLNDILHYDSTKTDSIQLQISRIECKEIQDDSFNVKVYVHPIDTAGNFLIGFDKFFIWCSIIDSNVVKTDTITQYNIIQKINDIYQPFSIAMVMDHSGSIGNERALIIQNAVKKFYNITNKNNKIHLLKFDHFIKEILIPETSDEIEIQNFWDNFISGLKNFGGSTALLDALGESIEILGNDTTKNKKVIIAFTDGIENSSVKYRSADTIVKLAKKHNIIICTIGFGDNIDRVFLADSLSQGTGGIFWNICKSNQFDIIFKDIYLRIVNYYLIEYNIPKVFGVHNVKIVLCDPKSNTKFIASNSYIPQSLKKDTAYIIQNIHYDFNKWDLNKEKSKKAINLLISIAKEDTISIIELHSYTDSIGKEDYNLELSRKRSNSVKDELIKAGIDPNRIKTFGHGEKNPIASNNTPEGRSLNRRTEIILKSNNFLPRKESYFKTPSETSQ